MSDGINIACRTCMRTNQNYIGILKHYECNRLIAEMLRECTTIKVEPFDDLPKYMCNNCTEKLISSWNFKSMALDADKKFRSINDPDKRLPIMTENGDAITCSEAMSIKEEEITVKVEVSDPLIVNNDISDVKLDKLIGKLNSLMAERAGCDLTETKIDDSNS
ncbi:zinc-finger associated domain containing protein, partial [Oryctes borbonicus]